MSKTQERPWWDDVSIQSGGDVIIGQVGAGAKGVAIGKNQAVYGTLGEPVPGDKQVIEKHFAEVAAAIQKLQGQMDTNTAKMAEFQLKLLQGELTKVDKDETPSASTINPGRRLAAGQHPSHRRNSHQPFCYSCGGQGRGQSRRGCYQVGQAALWQIASTRA